MKIGSGKGGTFGTGESSDSPGISTEDKIKFLDNLGQTILTSLKLWLIINLVRNK